MTKVWRVIHDDEMSLIDKTVEFLMSGFCPAGDDPMWSSDYFRWKLGCANPAGRGYLSIAMTDDRVVGCVSLTQKRLIVNGVQCIGGEVGDSYSDSALRHGGRPEVLSQVDENPRSYINKSVFGRLASETRARAEANGVALIYGTPNQNAYPGWTRRLGYFDFERAAIRSFARPTSRLVVRLCPRTRAIEGLLKTIEIGMSSAVRNYHKVVRGARVAIDAERPSDADLDDLWARTKPTRGLAVVRDSAYWRHRYVAHPLAKYELFTVRRRGRLLGVISTRLYTSRGKRYVAIAEWMIVDNDVSLSFCLAEIVHRFTNQGVDAYTLYASDAGNDRKAALASLFIPRSRIPLILADTEAARAFRNSGETAHIFLGNTDAI